MSSTHASAVVQLTARYHPIAVVAGELRLFRRKAFATISSDAEFHPAQIAEDGQTGLELVRQSRSTDIFYNKFTTKRGESSNCKDAQHSPLR